MIEAALQRVVEGERLSRGEMRDVMLALMSGDEDPARTGALLAALRLRGETTDEIAGAVLALLERAVPLPEAPRGTIDTCGTGGDGSHTFNISTVAALVVAACGVPVAKHGNRAATSRCGSAELLETLGVRIDIAPARMARAVAELGIGFLYARACHPAMAAVAPVRQALPFPTLFNRLGPLSNPMRPRRQLLGVARAELAAPALAVLQELGAERAWVVHSEEGLDEISLGAPTQVHALEDGKRREFRIDPTDYVPAADVSALAGGDPAENAAIARAILAGEGGPRRDVVLLNAAAGLCVAGVAGDLAEGRDRAASALDTGAARELLDRFVAFTREEAA